MTEILLNGANVAPRLRERTMAFESNAQRQATVATLTAHITGLAHGSVVTFLDVEKATNVPMRTGRDRVLLHEAIRRAGRMCSSIPGVGYVLSSADNAIDILSESADRITNAVKRAHVKATLALKIHPDMSASDIARVSAYQSMTGAKVAELNGESLKLRAKKT